MPRSIANLSQPQQDLLASWLPDAHVTHDYSWGLVETTVLRVESGGATYTVKAGGPSDGHISRELAAHTWWLEPWVSRGRAPRLAHGDAAAKLLVTTYLPGDLVLGSPAQQLPSTFRQAGELLALLHGQPGKEDDTFEVAENNKALRWLDQAHRINSDLTERLRAIIASWPTQTIMLVPTHGDWQPRNWLSQNGTVSVIDLGRAALRPAFTDLIRLDAQDFRDDPSGQLERAFYDGYGADPRTSGLWPRAKLREAIGTAVWAHRVGDEPFEAQGHRMIDEWLAEFGS